VDVLKPAMGVVDWERRVMRLLLWTII
jgi:hypothetical protein